MDCFSHLISLCGFSAPHDVGAGRTGLYMNPPDRAFELSINGNTQIQVLAQTQEGLPMKPGRSATMTRDYKQHGATNLLASLNILDGKVIGRYSECRRSQKFIELLDQTERTVPAGLDPTIRNRVCLSSGMDA